MPRKPLGANINTRISEHQPRTFMQRSLNANKLTKKAISKV